MFEPIHGSAPDVAGKNIANPLASIWSASQILDFFGYEDWGKEILASIEKVMTKGEVLTPDMGGHSSTQEVGEAVVAKLGK
jgi:tartrate dehydrogenase/decarboxylase/D-malate dehydrogenase